MCFVISPELIERVWQGWFFSRFSLETLRIANVIPGVSDASCSEALQKLKHGNSVDMWCVFRLIYCLKILVSFIFRCSFYKGVWCDDFLN